MDEKTIGEKLHETRLRKKYTLAKTAEVLNISLDYVSRIEKGERTPSKIVAAAIDEFVLGLDETIRTDTQDTPATPPSSAPLGDGVLDRALWSEATLDSQALFGDILGENVQKCYDRLLVKQGRSPESPPSAKTETPLKQAA